MNYIIQEKNYCYDGEKVVEYGIKLGVSVMWKIELALCGK